MAGDLHTEDEALTAIADVLTTTCGVEKPQPEDVEYFVSRLEEIRLEMEAESSGGAAASSLKTFGSSYADYLRTIPLDRIIMQMANYDFARAKVLYCVLDRSDVMLMVSEHIKGRMESGLLSLEACMYGFGGSYESNRASNVVTHDLKTDAGKQALKAFGF